ncbi:MAG: hypothetical protein P9M11_10835 [Candidatus Tenebribacter burtonii]|jgi:hypothetical protein|nr:hypothetical protein [Candidatus Tenebribacter burtonii]
MKKIKFLLLLTLFLFSCLSAEIISVDLPKKEAVELTPYASFDFADINESSAIVKSRVWDDVYWTLNDSGCNNRIFPFNSKGELYRAEWYKEKDGGIFIGNVINIDWEEMAIDNDGNLYICDTGNNFNTRKDLAIHVIKDPFPYATGNTTSFQTINFYYPEQKEFPAVPNNYDCEAVFWANDNLYLLTKHRANEQTHLYRFDSLDQLKINPVTRIGTFEIGGMVTAADASIDGTKLAVLTYDNIWVFEADDGDYFNGKISWLPITANQCEAVCFDGDDLIITNEQMQLFRLPVTEFIPVN